ncbi:MAG TPA: peptidyl-prolyl cis-trans isomerase [Isosphaeraceae bacterium]|jgi:peptidyl-prolyl cis-trans isomerase SurA|nr:peptidyl-prolyl cis-trans isomerase [Isosphaeraceae bacterium]
MRRVLVVALGLALAGCAQGPTARPRTIPALGPVGYSPIPPLSQSVNGGLAFQNSALNWPGGTAPSGADASRRVTALTPPARLDPKTVVAAATTPPAAATNAPTAVANIPSSPPAAPPAEPPRSIESTTGPQPIAAASPAPEATPGPTSPAPAADPTAPNPEPTAPAADPAAPTPEPAAPSTEPVAPKDEPAAPKDEPSELPPLPEPPGTVPAAPAEPPTGDEGKPAPAPTAPESPAPPPAQPESKPDSEGSPAPESAPNPEDAPLPDPVPSVEVPAPAVAEPAVTPPTGPDSTAPATETESEHAKPPADAGASAGAAALVDSSVRTVAAGQADVEADRLQHAKVLPQLPERELLEQTVARVGDEEITQHELNTIFGFENQGRILPESVKNQRLSEILDNIIDRKMLVQAAKRRIKQPQAWVAINGQVDVEWHERELPKYLKRYNAANEFELKKRFADIGYSLDDLHKNFQQEIIARDFMHSELSPKVKVDYREMRAYYEANKARFDRPAQVTWREVVVEVGKHKGRGEAKEKAAAVLARLRKGEDFGRVAKALSEGPKAKQGGLWITTPGSYGAAGVNAALDRLPIGRISTILEEPESFHIVRVEDRRAAGPADFDEVQDEIEDTIRQEKINKAMQAFLDKLRAGTSISRPTFTPATDDSQAR